jgi:hypothetical protein
MKNYLLILEQDTGIPDNNEASFSYKSKSYIENCIALRKKILARFQSNSIALSASSFYITTSQSPSEIEEIVMDICGEVYSNDASSYNKAINQIYIAEIKDIKYSTSRETQLAIEYLEKK